jgi:hypothetical protein
MVSASVATTNPSGGDDTGPIRMPASCCGLVGLKPRRGRSSFALPRVNCSTGWRRSARLDPTGSGPGLTIAFTSRITLPPTIGDADVAPPSRQPDRASARSERERSGLLRAGPTAVSPPGRFVRPAVDRPPGTAAGMPDPALLLSPKRARPGRQADRDRRLLLPRTRQSRRVPRRGSRQLLSPGCGRCAPRLPHGDEHLPYIAHGPGVRGARDCPGCLGHGAFPWPNTPESPCK